MTFITDLMKQPLATARLDRSYEIAPDPDTNEIEVVREGSRNKVAVPRSLKTALSWLARQDGCVPLTAWRKHFGTESDSPFGLLQAAAFITSNVVVVGVACPRNKLLVEIEYSNYGKRLPDMSNPRTLRENEKITLSRFSYLHREDERFLLSMPLKDKRFVIRDRAVQTLLSELAFGADLRQIQSVCAGDDNLFEGFRRLINVLYNEEFVISAGGNSSRLPTRLEEGDSAMQQWDFHDLVTHSNSRVGYNFGFDFGGAFPFVNLIEPQPAVKPPPEGERIALYKPALQELVARDKTLTDTVIQRISVRAYNEESPVSLQQLGEFFFRTGRLLYENSATVTNAKNPDRQTEMGFAWRPYPTGGASYELEFYLTVDRADGIDPGIYYYSPGTHELIKLSGRNAHTEGLIETAYFSCAKIVRPQTVIHIAARFQRVAWKYHNIAYSTMLRNTGVVYQTFYLHATAMGLAGCGLGSGNTELFSLATGNAPHIECNIGEFMLGSMPKDYTDPDLPASAMLHNAKLSPTAY